MKNIKTTLLVDGNITATKLKSLSSVQISDDTDTASESKVGCIRYRDSETGSYLEMCMQVDTGVYSWIPLKMYTFSNYPVDYSGTVYFVSSSGNDSNDGLTSSTPWQTLDKINSMSYSAGDAILLDSSSSFIGSIAVPNSGSSEASITIGAYGTNISKPKIYGSELITDWTLHTGNIWKATVDTSLLKATSSTSVSIGSGTKTFTVETGLKLFPGSTLIATYNSSNYMSGIINSYNKTTGQLSIVVQTLGVDPNAYVGSGTYTSWSIKPRYILNQVFVNGSRMQAARFPTTGYATVDSAPSTSSLTDAALNGALDYTGTICLIHSSSYGLDRRTVISSSGTTLQLNSAPFDNVTANEKYILIGKLDFLTAAGQWYYDEATEILYLWKLDGTAPSDIEVRGSTLDYGIRADSKDYVTVSNVEILHQKTDGIYFTNSDYFVFNNLKATNNNSVGIHNYLGHHGTIEYCTVNGSNHFGIENYSSSGNCQINYNDVSDIALFNNLGLSGIGSWFNGSGIYNQNSVTNAYTAGQINYIRYNRVNNVGYNGIHFANEGVAEFNYITYCGDVKNDGGFIYTAGGPDVDHAGVNANSLIRYNIGLYGTGIGSSPYFEGMYADEYSENVTIEYNTVGYSTRGLFLHNGKNNIGRYNTIFNTENGLYVSRDGDGVQLNNNIVYGLTGQEVIHRNITTGTLMVNNNIYVNRYMSNPFELDWTNHYTFTNWKSTTGYDVASTFIGDALGVGESQRLIVNTTTTPKTFYINNATVKEIDGTSIPTSFTLAAFASKIVEGTNLDCILDYSDAVAPTITAFVLPETSEIFTVTPTTVTATGEATLFNITNVNVAPALDASGWSLTPTYIAATSGSLTLYLWARDAAGNISGSLSDTTVITAERIGYFTTPTSSSTSTARRAMPVTFTEDGEIQSVSVYVNNLGGGMLVGVYADNSNAPGVKIGSALQVTRPSVEGWVEVTLTAPVSVTNGQKVWLAVTTENNGLMYLAGSPGRNQSTGLWVEGLPDPFGASTNSAFNYAIYCTYLK